MTDVPDGCFEPNNSEDLASTVQQLWADPSARYREQARSEFELKYRADSNHDRLVEIYDRAVHSQTAPPFLAVG